MDGRLGASGAQGRITSKEANVYSLVMMMAIMGGGGDPASCGELVQSGGCGGCFGCVGCGGGGLLGRIFHRSESCFGCEGCVGCQGCFGCTGGCFGSHRGGLLRRFHRSGCEGCFGCDGGCFGCVGGTAPVTMPVSPAPAKPAEQIPPAKEKKEEVSAPGSGRIMVELPADAKLFVDDRPTNSSERQRLFVTPELEGNRGHTYVLRAVVIRDGKVHTEVKQVDARPGETVKASFENLNATEPDQAVVSAE